jgi:aminotransferase in exopolysaccharide biosynthesis
MIPLSVPNLKGNEWTYIKECIDTEWVSSVGKYVDLFERNICEYTKSKYAVACINGTAALHVALRLVGVKEGDEVLVPTITFIATANAVHYLNAKPIFMDCDSFLNINIEKTITFIKKNTYIKNGFSYNKKTGNKIMAIIPVHVSGNAVDIEPLLNTCRDHNIKIIEDACESLGTQYIKGKLAKKHAGTIGDIGCLSFNGNKIITTGGGGMILCKDKKLAERAKFLTTQAKKDELRYVHDEIGYNYRLTNIQAALGVAQLEQLPEFIKNKRKIFKSYKDKVDLIPGLKVSAVPAYAKNNHWMTSINVEKKVYGRSSDELMNFLAKNNIQSRPVWKLNHLQRPYKHCQNYNIETASELVEKTLHIPCGVNLSDQQINEVIDKLNEGKK